MVVVEAPQDVDMERDASCLGERVEYVRNHLTREVANLFPLELKVAAKVRSGGDVEDCSCEGLDNARSRSACRAFLPSR